MADFFLIASGGCPTPITSLSDCQAARAWLRDALGPAVVHTTPVVSAEASPQPEPEPPTESRAEPAPEDASTATPKMEGSWRTFLESDAEADRTAAGGDVDGSDSIFTRGGKGAVTEL